MTALITIADQLNVLGGKPRLADTGESLLDVRGLLGAGLCVCRAEGFHSLVGILNLLRRNLTVCICEIEVVCLRVNLLNCVVPLLNEAFGEVLHVVALGLYEAAGAGRVVTFCAQDLHHLQQVRLAERELIEVMLGQQFIDELRHCLSALTDLSQVEVDGVLTVLHHGRQRNAQGFSVRIITHRNLGVVHLGQIDELVLDACVPHKVSHPVHPRKHTVGNVSVHAFLIQEIGQHVVTGPEDVAVSVLGQRTAEARTRELGLVVRLLPSGQAELRLRRIGHTGFCAGVDLAFYIVIVETAILLSDQFQGVVELLIQIVQFLLCFRVQLAVCTSDRVLHSADGVLDLVGQTGIVTYDFLADFGGRECLTHEVCGHFFTNLVGGLFHCFAVLFCGELILMLLIQLACTLNGIFNVLNTLGQLALNDTVVSKVLESLDNGVNEFLVNTGAGMHEFMAENIQHRFATVDDVAIEYNLITNDYRVLTSTLGLEVFILTVHHFHIDAQLTGLKGGLDILCHGVKVRFAVRLVPLDIGLSAFHGGVKGAENLLLSVFRAVLLLRLLCELAELGQADHAADVGQEHLGFTALVPLLRELVHALHFFFRVILEVLVLTELLGELLIAGKALLLGGGLSLRGLLCRRSFCGFCGGFRLNLCLMLLNSFSYCGTALSSCHVGQSLLAAVFQSESLHTGTVCDDRACLLVRYIPGSAGVLDDLSQEFSGIGGLRGFGFFGLLQFYSLTVLHHTGDLLGGLLRLFGTGLGRTLNCTNLRLCLAQFSLIHALNCGTELIEHLLSGGAFFFGHLSTGVQLIDDPVVQCVCSLGGLIYLGLLGLCHADHDVLRGSRPLGGLHSGVNIATEHTEDTARQETAGGVGGQLDNEVLAGHGLRVG